MEMVVLKQITFIFTAFVPDNKYDTCILLQCS
jgi:hypothetical protein